MKCQLVNTNIKTNYGENLLKERGIEDIELFLNPTEECRQKGGLDYLQDGAALLNKVIKNNDSSILIVVDSDDDGFTSAAIMYQYIKRLNPNVLLQYCLHSGKQHGLEDHIDWLEQAPHYYDLVICPDSSSNDRIYHDRLGSAGTQVLVLDHHIMEEAKSDHAVIINNQISDKYKNKDLTGAGVVYQFCKYFDEFYGYDCAEEFIDLAALGIIGDMGSMLSLENRYFVYNGLQNINNFFFKALIDKQSYSMGGKVTPFSVAFYIVPLINAMIRVGSQEEKERLFDAFIDGERLIPSNKRGAKGTFEKNAIESARECTNAKAKQNRIKDAAVDRLIMKIHKHDLLNNRVLLVRLDDDDDFPAELNGLVAMTLAANFKKPTIVARLNEQGYVRGSARGLNESKLEDFRQFLIDSSMFEYAQGHANAFGCSILNDDLSQFHTYANEALKDIDFGENVYNVNFERYANDSDVQDLIMDIAKYENIWGTGNDEPLIYVKGINITKDDIQVIGSSKDTVKFLVNGVVYIQFHAKQLIEDLNKYPEMSLEVVGRANINKWGGYTTPQIFIKNYEIKRSDLAF